MMRAASCFSGIGGAELALPEARWLWSSELDPFANAVRAARLADNNLGDVLGEDFLERAAAFGPLDLLVGGPPCQDFSVAGLRAGLEGARGNLTLRWVQVVHALRPRWVLTENVPGWLSVGRGHAFGAFVAGLVGHDTALLPPKGCGGRWTDAGMAAGPLGRLAWRIMDAQHHGLAQRRRRVFVVYCPGDGDDPAAVLFEPACLRGDPAPRRETREGTASTLAGCAAGGSGYRNDADTSENLIADTVRSHPRPGSNSIGNIARSLNAHPSRSDGESETFVTHALDSYSAGRMTEDGTGRGCPIVTHSLRADGFDASEDGTGRGTPLVTTLAIRGRGDSHDLEWREDGTANAVLTPNGGRGGIGVGAIAFTLHGADKTVSTATETQLAGSVRTKPPGSIENSSTTAVLQTSAVRRLTPRECERLQGVPDDYTLVSYRGKLAADGNRYRALGNGFAVPVVRWILLRVLAATAAPQAAAA